MSEKTVAIIILNWNNKEDALECMHSVGMLKAKEKADIFLVDNGSSDDSLLFLKQKFPDVRYISNPRNLGYAGGNNVGIKEALKSGYCYVLLLNNDLVVDPGSLDELLAVMEKDCTVGLAGAVNYYYSERSRIQFSGGHIDWFRGNIYDFTRHSEDKGQYSPCRQVEAVAGSCMLIRTEVFKRTGLLDERFFLNFEETDFCCRVKREGYSVVTSMRARVWHKVSLSFQSSENCMAEYFLTRNKLLFLWKNSPKKYLVFSISYYVLTLFRKILKSIIKSNYRHVRAIIRGFMDGISGRYYEGSMEKFLSR